MAFGMVVTSSLVIHDGGMKSCGETTRLHHSSNTVRISKLVINDESIILAKIPVNEDE